MHTLQRDGLGRLGKLAARAVIIGGIGQIEAIAAGNASDTFVLAGAAKVSAVTASMDCPAGSAAR